MKDVDISSARLSNVFNSYLGENGNEQEGSQQNLPSFANVFTERRRSGVRQHVFEYFVVTRHFGSPGFFFGPYLI